MAERYDTIVVGTGIGGLTAGLGLARAGHRVLLLEAGKQYGGMLNPFARKRYHFDVGVHYVGEADPGQAMRRILDSLGLEEIRFREIDPDCIDRYTFGDYEARLVKGIDRWADLLCADFPAEAASIRRFITLMKAVRDLSRTLARGPGWRRSRGLVRHAPKLARATLAPLSTLLDATFRDPYLKAVFAGPGGDIGLPPSRASALISIMVLNHFLAGGYYPIGGSGAMRDAFVAQLRAHGATLKRSQLVTRIDARGADRFEVHTARGDRFEARSVVSNVDATHTLEMVTGTRPPALVRRRAARLRPSLGCFCLFVGTDLDLAAAGLSDSNIWHYGTPDLESGYAAAFDGRIPERPHFFLTAPSLKDPETVRAPAGHHTVEMITFLPAGVFKPWFDKPAMKRGAAYEAIKAEVAARLLEGAERYVPGLGDHAIIQESASPATVWHFVRGREGGIYGPEHTPDQVGARRLFTSVGVPGLYLAGASVLGAGIFTCLASGMLAARACDKHLHRTRPMRMALAALAAAAG